MEPKDRGGLLEQNPVDRVPLRASALGDDALRAMGKKSRSANRAGPAERYEKALLTALLSLPQDRLAAAASNSMNAGLSTQAMEKEIHAENSSGKLDVPQAVPATAPSAMLPTRRTASSAAAKKSSRPVEDPELFLRTLTGLPPVPARSHGEVGFVPSSSSNLGLPSRALTADAIAAAARLPAGSSALAARVADFGNYPLATRERVQVATLERLKKEQLLREKKMKADELRAKFEAKQAAKEAVKPKKHGSDDEYDDDGTDDGSSSATGAMSKFLRDPKTGKVRLKKAARLIQMSAAFAKPPEQKAKQQIKALQSSAHKQALKKLLYGWATVQLAFRVMATEDFTWPAAPEGSELPLPVAPPNPDGDDNDDQGAASGSPLSKLDEQEGNGSPSQLPSSSASARSTGGGSQAAATADGAAAGAVDTAVASNSSAQVPYNFKGGIKGTLGLRDIFGLLGHGLGLLPSEQAYIVDELVLAQANEKGHSLKEASTLASKIYAVELPEYHHSHHGSSNGSVASRASSQKEKRKRAKAAAEAAAKARTSTKRNNSIRAGGRNRSGSSGGGGGARSSSPSTPVRGATPNTGRSRRTSSPGGGTSPSRALPSLLANPPGGFAFEGAPPSLANRDLGTPLRNAHRNHSRSGFSEGLGDGGSPRSAYSDGGVSGSDDDDDEDNPYRGYTPLEVVEAQADDARNAGWPAIVTYKDFEARTLKTVEPAFVAELWADIAKAEAYKNKVADADRATQMALIEKQAQRRAPLVAELTRKLDFPPTKTHHKPKDGRGPTVVVPTPHAYNTRARVKQLSALLKDGGMVLELLLGEGGGLGSIMNCKKAQLSQSNNALGSAGLSGLHIPLAAGRPYGGIKECVLTAAKYGSGLQGLSPAECVETLWQYCAERIQSCHRGLLPRRQQGGALRMWREREKNWKRRVFKAWWNAARNTLELRYRCKSPFKFWRKYVDKMLILHHLFAKCFWPIYIWRKTTREAILERQKANLLKNLYVCSFTLHVFRAWKKFAMQKMAKKKRCDDHYAAFQAKKATRSFHFWRRCCHRDKYLEVNWLRRGMRTHDDKELEVLWRCVTVWRYWRTLQKIVAVRASQFWRVISADRAQAAAIATADVKAKKRKTRKQRDAKALAAAQKEQELARQKLYEGFPALPRLRQLPWGKGLPTRLHTLCAKMLPYMDKELVRECGQRHLCYWREGPRFFKNMRDMVLLRKKSTVALRKYGRQTRLLVFLEWHKEIKRKMASREARKQERAAARLVAKQRAVALATARAQGQKFLIAQLEAEQTTADKAAQLKSFARRERLQAAGRSSNVNDDDKIESDHSSDDDDELGEIAEEREAEAREAELLAKAAAAAASPHNKSASALLQAFSSETKVEPPAKPLLLHGIAQTAQFRQKGMLWRQKAKLAAKPMVGSILDHDRAARAEQLKRFHSVVAKVERESLALEKERDAHVDEHADWVNGQAASTLALSEFFDDEAGKMERAGNREVKYVSELKMHTARTILHLLNTVRHNSEKALDYLIAWRYFRALRVPYYDRKAFHLRNKQKLRNWLRHCVRLQRLDRGMPRFRKLRVLWRCWHKLLRHAENRRKNRTPALRDHLVALSNRAGRFNALLQARGVCGELPVPMEELHSKTTDLRACLLRWAAYAADVCHARATSRLVAWRAQYTRRRRALQGLMLAGLGIGKATQTLERAARKAKEAEIEALEAAEQERAESLDYGESYRDLPSCVQSGAIQGGSSSSAASTVAVPAVAVASGSGTSSVNQSAAGSVRSSMIGSSKPAAEEGPHDRAAKRRKRALIGRDASRAKTTYPGQRQRRSSGGDDGSGDEPESGSSYGGMESEQENEVGSRQHHQAMSSSSNTTANTVRSHNHSVTKKADNSNSANGRSTTDDAASHEFDGIMRDDVPVGRTNFKEVVKSATAHMATAAFLDAASGKLGSGHLNQIGDLNIEGASFGKGSGLVDGWEGREGEARWPYAPPQPKTYAEQRLQEDLSAWRDMYANKRARCVATLTRRCNRRRAAEVAFKARNGPSFKKYIATLRADASRRLALERSLLLDAFVTRGKLGFEDYSVASMPQTAQPESSESHSNGGDKKKKKSKKGVVASNDPHSEATTLGVAAEEPPMPGDTSFVDKVVWGGFALGEVTVFTSPGLGIVGVCLTYRGDGPGQVELLPQGGLRAPHGKATENITTFKLEHPYEHVYAVTMVISSGSFEALQCHVAAPDGTHLRDSPLLGRPFSADARRVVLRGTSSKDMLVGLRGRFSPHRVTALGLQMRHVTSARHVFSCHWTPSKVEATANATLAKHALVLQEAHAASLARAQDALSGGGDERAGQKRSTGANTGPDGMPLPPTPVLARPSSAEKLLAQRAAARDALLQKVAEEEAAAKALAEKEAAEKAAAEALDQEGGAEMSPLKGGEGGGSVGASSSSTMAAAGAVVTSSRPSTGGLPPKDEPNFLVGSGIAAGYGLKEQWRVAIEAGKEAEKDAIAGNWEKYAPGKTLRTAEEEEVQVAEFMAVLRMRSVDVSAAAARSEAFVRRMWSGTVCDKHHTDTHKLRTLGLITSLGRWLFRALCFSLAPDPPCPPDIPDRLEARSIKFLHAAAVGKKASGDLHHRALEADAAPRTWATFGLMSPADRDAEANFRAQLAEWRHESSRLAAKAARYKEEGEGYAAAALALRPQLRNTFAAHVYYRKRLELARTQRRMEAEFGRQYFTATLNAVAAGKAHSTLTRQQLEELAHAVEPLPPGLSAPGQVDF